MYNVCISHYHGNHALMGFPYSRFTMGMLYICPNSTLWHHGTCMECVRDECDSDRIRLPYLDYSIVDFGMWAIVPGGQG